MILRNLRPIASLLLAAALLLAGNGAQFTLLPLRGQAEGFSTLALGVMGSAYYVGFVAGCLSAPPVVLRVGHIRAFTSMVAVAAATTLAYEMAPQPVAWSLFRLITGFALAGFYLVLESWLNDGATNATRGFVMSAYVIVNYLAVVGGQALKVDNIRCRASTLTKLNARAPMHDPYRIVITGCRQRVAGPEHSQSRRPSRQAFSTLPNHQFRALGA